MDRLSLEWREKTEYAAKTKVARNRAAKKSSEPELAIFVNDQSLDVLIAEHAKARGKKTLGDVFLWKRLVEQFAKRQWLASCEGDGYVTLMACGCGFWECSTIDVEAKAADNWVHWRFDLSDVYQEHFGDLPEFWFDREAYSKVISQFDF